MVLAAMASQAKPPGLADPLPAMLFVLRDGAARNGRRTMRLLGGRRLYAYMRSVLWTIGFPETGHSRSEALDPESPT